MATFLMTIGTIAIPLAFIFKALYPADNSMAIIAGIVGVGAVVAAYIKTNRDESDDRERRKELTGC